MVEVFKTNVTTKQHANLLLKRINKTFANYKANFDLHDCDKILRVQCATEIIRATSIINLLHELGFKAEILPDKNIRLIAGIAVNF